MKPLFSFILLLVSLTIFSKGEPMKYGKITQEEIDMITYPIESSAPAVVLCNYGYKANFRRKITISIVNFSYKCKTTATP